MVKIIRGGPPPQTVDAPGHEPDIKRPAEGLHSCGVCFSSYKETRDPKFLGAHAEFTKAYWVSEGNGQTHRVYFCPMYHVVKGQQVGGIVFAAVVHFRRCPYKNEIIEQETTGGDNKYVTCLEPFFKCDRARHDLPLKEWFCETLDAAPLVRFIDVYNDPWFAKMEREWIDEDMLKDTEGFRKWQESRKMKKR